MEHDVRVAAGCFPAFCFKRTQSLTLSSVALNFDPFDFLEREFLAGEILQFSSTLRFVVRDVLSVLQRASILPVSCNPKGVTPGGIGKVRVSLEALNSLDQEQTNHHAGSFQPAN